MSTILDRILETKRAEVAERKRAWRNAVRAEPLWESSPTSRSMRSMAPRPRSVMTFAGSSARSTLASRPAAMA